MDQVQLSLIYRPWKTWKICELNNPDHDSRVLKSLSNYFWIALTIINWSLFIFLRQHSEKLLNYWFNPRLHCKYVVFEYFVSFSNSYPYGNAWFQGSYFFPIDVILNWSKEANDWHKLIPSFGYSLKIDKVRWIRKV
jgi:hypothetical protein